MMHGGEAITKNLSYKDCMDSDKLLLIKLKWLVRAQV